MRCYEANKRKAMGEKMGKQKTGIGKKDNRSNNEKGIQENTVNNTNKNKRIEAVEETIRAKYRRKDYRRNGN